MLQGIGNNNAIAAQTQGMSASGTVSGPGGVIGATKDAESSTSPKFGEIYQQIQAKYGARPEKPREIKKTLGKDDFLRIMITQMRHQDPTNPFKPEQMAAEMAQFASVEQLQNVNQNLAKMTSQNQPLERLAMTNMIGKIITVDRDRFPHTEGINDSLAYVIPKDASEVRVAIVAESGETVFEKNLGPQKAGESTFSWDGLKINSLPAKTGNYMLRVEATDERGQSMQTDSKTQARVIGVSFEGSEPVFLIGDAKRQDKVTLRNIIRIESDSAVLPSSSSPAQTAGAGSVPAQKAPNFISFQKGVGSSNLTPEKVTPEIAAALERFQQQNPTNSAGEQNVPQPGTVENNSEKGFPNGLTDPDLQVNEAQPQNLAKGGDTK